MPDFHQPILLPTLHHLAETKLEEREALLKRLSADRPIALIIPALYAELERKALPRMLKQLAKVGYLSEIIFSMNGMSKPQYENTRKVIAKSLPNTAHTILWNDGPSLSLLHNTVDTTSAQHHVHGKGSNVWMGMAYLLSKGHHGVIACHDSDIVNYDRDMLWRLCLPVASPEMNYVFAKSYYGRVRKRMYGRVTRLLVFPLIQALREVFGSTPLLRFLAMCRYPLSGEFAAHTNFLSKIGLASNWGLEIGMLCDVFRQAPSQRMCQIDLGGNFEHKHQHLGYDPATGHSDTSSGLTRMAREVTCTLLAHLWSDLGFSAEARKLERLADTYLATAQTLVTRYSHEALFNALEDISDDEQLTITVFAEIIRQSAEQCSESTPEVTALPSWRETLRVIPDFGERIQKSME